MVLSCFLLVNVALKIMSGCKQNFREEAPAASNPVQLSQGLVPGSVNKGGVSTPVAAQLPAP